MSERWNALQFRQSQQTGHRYLCRTLEMEASYVEEVHCVAMHPAAGLLLLGFHDKLRLLCIRDEELRWGDRACNGP